MKKRADLGLMIGENAATKKWGRKRHSGDKNRIQ